jgi:peptidyl-prolyl cis-trans isomerase A (cyclophilin A)
MTPAGVKAEWRMIGKKKVLLPMSSKFYRAVLLLTLLAAAGSPAFRASAQDGIYADFVTSMGNFTCKLDYTLTPKTVANFIGLATGEQRWVDFTTGTVRSDPYYNGIYFHRVITNFMIQGGSRNGQGTDGPGYTFVDEFSSSLNFSKPWKLAMANSGPDDNGAQFFLTVAPTTWLNNKHAIFGSVVSGTNVVAAISKVATDENDKPKTNVVIERVDIRRVGSAAQAFNIRAQALPAASNILMTASASGTNLVALGYHNQLYAQNRMFSSTNLVDWSEEGTSIETSEPMTNRLYRVRQGDRKFYRFAQIKYPSSTFAPKTLTKRKLILTSSGGAKLTLTFDHALGGTVVLSPGGTTSTIAGYTWNQYAYNGEIPFIFFQSMPSLHYLRFNFTKEGAGTFSGYESFTTPVTGTFTLSAPLP